MNLDELADELKAKESTDGAGFRRRARVLQSLWRKEQGLPLGEHEGEDGPRPLGSRLPMPEAKDNLWNFITDNVQKVVKDEVCDPIMSKGKLYGKPRIFNDLLSSQPLCFNLFAELKYDLDLASALISDISNNRFVTVTDIIFEHSPGRRDPRYLNDRSAFDVFIQCQNQAGESCFIGIEVKYHENLKGKPGEHKSRYDEVADLMGCFHENRSPLLKSPLQQIWRDHLLAGITHIEDRYSDSMFVTLYPKDNHYVAGALHEYESHLRDKASFGTWMLEKLVETLLKKSNAEWIRKFYDRYLAFEKIDRILEKAD